MTRRAWDPDHDPWDEFRLEDIAVVDDWKAISGWKPNQQQWNCTRCNKVQGHDAGRVLHRCKGPKDLVNVAKVEVAIILRVACRVDDPHLLVRENDDAPGGCTLEVIKETSTTLKMGSH